MFLSLIAGIVAFALTVFAMPHFIRIYQLKKIGGQQMHEDVKQHLAKAGTPTMGGIIIMLGIIITNYSFKLSKGIYNLCYDNISFTNLYDTYLWICCIPFKHEAKPRVLY